MGSRSETFRVSDILVRRYYISTGVPQPSFSSSNPNMHFKASKHQLLLNHNVFGCAFTVYCLYKYAKAMFKLSSDSASINLDCDYGNFVSVFPTFSSANMQKSERKQTFYSFFSEQTKELKAV